MTSDTDRIEKQVVLRAPQERVWQAISEAKEFGHWFGAELDGPFVAGARLHARVQPTQVDPEVARAQEPHAGSPFEIYVERVEPISLLSFRWHPELEPGGDPADAPTTLVVFALEAVAEGTRLTITESGFDAIPLARRAKAFASNSEGWEAQTRLIAKHLAQVAGATPARG